MFTIFDLELLCADPKKFTGFLMKNGLLSAPPDSCSSCGGHVTEVRDFRGKPAVKCKRKGCQIWIPCSTNSLLEGCRLPHKDMLYLLYFWAHDSAGDRSVNMLGFSKHTVADWSQRLRLCVANAEKAAEKEAIALKKAEDKERANEEKKLAPKKERAKKAKVVEV